MTTLHIDELGTGQNIVLMHGVACEPRHLLLLARELAHSHRCLVVHAPGYGKSPS